MSNGLVLFIFLHVLLSVAGIASGAIVAGGFLCGRRLELLTTFFLATTLATSVTGFLFPVDRLMPAHIVGMVSVVLLSVAYMMRGGTSRGRRMAFVASALAALYLECIFADRAGVYENPAPPATCPHSNRTPVCRRPSPGSDCLYWPRSCVRAARRQEIAGNVGHAGISGRSCPLIPQSADHPTRRSLPA